MRHKARGPAKVAKKPQDKKSRSQVEQQRKRMASTDIAQVSGVYFGIRPFLLGQPEGIVSDISLPRG